MSSWRCHVNFKRGGGGALASKRPESLVGKKAVGIVKTPIFIE